MVQLLVDNPLLLLFIVAAIGYPLGKISVGGSSLGVAAVLFVGLVVGALHPALMLPELIYQLGLVLFVYTVGLSCGRQFFASFRSKGLRDNLFVVSILTVATVLTLVIATVLRLRAEIAAGLFTGSLTNTPALASVIEYVKTAAGSGAADLLAEPVVAFSITYPMGVIGMMLCMQFLRRVWGIDYALEARQLGAALGTDQHLENQAVRITNPDVCQENVQHLTERQHWNIVFGRIRQNGHLEITRGETRLQPGDIVTMVGPSDDLQRATAYLGEPSEDHIDLDRSEYDYRRIFVSDPNVAGRPLRELRLPQQYGAIVTRLRRGDSEMVPQGDTVLELGDRVRVLARRENIGTVSTFFGDSYRALSEIDVLTFTLGLALGLLVGMIPIPLGSSVVIKLGFAGGPLMIALVLGALERTGPLVWTLPYSANLTLRQIGLIFFLAGIGTRSGYAFVSTLTQGGGALIFIAGAIVTMTSALLVLWIGYRLFRIPMSLLIGMLAGLQTQPALLGYALQQTKNDLPNVGYASVYPVALISKILLAQIILVLLS